MTLHFEATVGPPRQGTDGSLPPEWGIALQAGDTVSGAFTFEPFDAPSNVSSTVLVQPFNFSIGLDSHLLTSSRYEIEVSNDHTFDDPPATTDGIHAGCSLAGGGTVCSPATISPSSPVQWGFSVAMFGNSGLLDGADIPSNANVWQQFEHYDMIVTFYDASTGHFFGFQATPHSFNEVPEVGACILVVMGAILPLLFWRRARELYSASH